MYCSTGNHSSRQHHESQYGTDLRHAVNYSPADNRSADNRSAGN